MTLVETWKDQNRVAQRAMGAHTKKFLEDLLPINDRLYDECLCVVVSVFVRIDRKSRLGLRSAAG